MDMSLPGHLYAKSPIDMACWDIAGQSTGQTIADLMGGGSLPNTCALAGYVSPRLCPDGSTRAEGRIAPPEGPDLGVTPDLDTIGHPLMELA